MGERFCQTNVSYFWKDKFQKRSVQRQTRTRMTMAGRGNQKDDASAKITDMRSRHDDDSCCFDPFDEVDSTWNQRSLPGVPAERVGTHTRPHADLLINDDTSC